MIKYDYDIREYFNFDCNIQNIIDTISDYDMLRLATELLRNATDRLDNDLDNDAIKNEYNKLTTIILMLQEIIDNYV